MTFIQFLSNLPLGNVSVVLAALVAFLVVLGMYKFVKDWLPW